jgi:hypothetical protein
MKKLYTGILLSSIALLSASCLKEDINTSEGTPGVKTFIYAIRQLYQGNEITLNPEKLGGANLVSGIVISDKGGQNIEPGSFILQQTVENGNQVGDLTSGIVIKTSGGASDYNMGDSLTVNVVGGQLNRINGKLTISGIAGDKITKIPGTGNPEIRPVTLAMLNLLMDQYESTLVSVHADVADYGAAVTYGGERKLKDNTGPEFLLLTRNEAAFAGANVPVNAQFTGIAGYYNASAKDTAGAKKVISLRTASDVKFASGALYAGFPESFEFPDFTLKASYNSNNTIDLSTGSWTLQQALLGNTVLRDKYNPPGKQCVRMQQNLTTSAYVQMNFNVPDGASKVTVFYGKYYTDPTSTFRLEYSINNGTSWVVIAPNISDMPERGSRQASFPLNLTGPVRFRINKLGLGTSSATIFNGRLCIEDFAVYKKL